MSGSHYDSPGLAAQVLAALPKGPLTARDLAPLDQFHVGGLRATRQLAEAAGLTPGLRVVDLGSGIGGPSRWLAAERGCIVTGIDLSWEYTALASALASRAGVAEVRYVCGDALAPPLPAGAFDVVWTQHASMNINDRPRLAAVMAALLKPGGRLALHDVCAGPGGALHLPVPWASRAEDSHLVPLATLRRQFEAAGLSVRHWRDATAEALDFLTAAAGQPRPALSLHLLLGDDIGRMVAHYRRNLEEGRAVVVEAVLERGVHCSD